MTLRNALLGVSLCGLLAGCCMVEQQSGIMTEDAIVEDVVYTPAQHGTGVGPSFGAGGGSVAVVSVDVAPAYAVVFRCQHGKFIVHDKKEWEKRVRGESVTVFYRECYCEKMDGRHLTGYDFLHAEHKEGS